MKHQILIVAFGLLVSGGLACQGPPPTLTTNPTPTVTPGPTPTPSPPPAASFSMDVSSGSAPLTIHFSDTSQGLITFWRWDFGDGDSSTEQNPTHQYTRAGSSTVRLTVSGPGGTGLATLSGAVNLVPGLLAEAVVSPSPITLPVQQTTRLIAAAFDQFGNEISDIVFTWNADGPGGRIDETGLST